VPVRRFPEIPRRLLRQAGRKVLLILDWHPVHRAGVVQHWLAPNTERLASFFLPGYSPELNPDEYLNNGAKGDALGRQRPGTQPALMDGAGSYLLSTQRQPDVVRSCFRAEHVCYAAG